jgi:hypothetical protein
LRNGFCHLFYFFEDFFDGALFIFPVETGFSGSVLNFLSSHKCRHGTRYVSQILCHRFDAFFFKFVFLPDFQCFFGAGGFILTEDMSMAENELGAETAEHIVDVEFACFSCYFRMENSLKQKISRFFGNFFRVIFVNSRGQFVGFLDGIMTN